MKTAHLRPAFFSGPALLLICILAFCGIWHFSCKKEAWCFVVHPNVLQVAAESDVFAWDSVKRMPEAFIKSVTHIAMQHSLVSLHFTEGLRK